MPLERELKFSLLDETFPSKLELEPAFIRAGFRLVADGLTKQKDVYFDDTFSSIKKAGWALRTRRIKNNIVATLKAAGQETDGIHEREEIEAEFITNWPASIQTKLLSITYHDLKAVLELNTERVEYRIFTEFKHEATLSFDQVSANYPNNESNVQFSEAELEAVNASNEKLEQIASLIDSVTAINKNSSNKLERALVLLSLSETL